MGNSTLLVGALISVSTLVGLVWSIFAPKHRVWPPNHYTNLTPWLVWIPTFALTLCLIFVGLDGWNEWHLPSSLRFVLGLPLIVLGTAGVWFHVWVFGIHKTGGSEGTLETRYLYRFSRNPQYVSDIFITVGWVLLSANTDVLILGGFATAILVVAPFAEEPWLENRYGAVYREYRQSARRFF